MSIPSQPEKKSRRWKRMPLLDDNGEYAVTFEFRPVTNPLVHERFVHLANLLYQKWVVDSPPSQKPSSPTPTDSTTKETP